VESNGGKAFVLQDRLPQVHYQTVRSLDGRVNIVFICTYSVDEPYKEVFKAARMISEDVMIYVTGGYEGKVDPSCIPANVKLLGFVPDDKFWALLSSSDLVMDLTLREGCLVCGAYEGVALLKPLILSDTKALRSYFNEGCIYVAPDAESIAQGIRGAIRDIEGLRCGIQRLKERLENSWGDTFKDLVNTIESIG
jgi:glycosyltransferase involved in cell wall biosynthesis